MRFWLRLIPSSVTVVSSAIDFLLGRIRWLLSFNFFFEEEIMYLSLSLLKTRPFVADHSKTVLMSFSNMRVFCKMSLGRHVL